MPRELYVGSLEVKLCDHVPQYAVPLPREEVSLPGLIIGTDQIQSMDRSIMVDRANPVGIYRARGYVELMYLM